MAIDFPNSPSNGQVYTVGDKTWVYGDGKWQGGVGPGGPLDNLSDVTITSPEEFQILSYNGTEWVNSHIPLVSYVQNAETTTLTTGTCVYLFGGTGDHASVKRADNNSDTTSSKTIGLVGANIAASQNGPVITRGYVDGIDLSTGYSVGDVLWLGENGAFTKTKATAPDHLVFIGVVVRATNNGIVYVATQNGYELDEIHNVSLVDLASGDFLKYNGTLWVNDAINLGTDTVGDYVSSVSGGTGISVNFTPGEGVGASVSLNATLDNLSDVTVPSPSSGDFLKWNGTAWVNDPIDLGTDTTGNYVQNLVAGTGITLTNGSASEGGTPTVSVTANTYVDLSTINAKGDLLVGTADNTLTVLTVGTTGYVLTADSSTATGVKWAAVASGGGLSTTTEGAIMIMDIGA